MDSSLVLNGTDLADVDDVADFLIMRFDGDAGFSVLKLQKMLYYVQAWSLALYDKACFAGGFQAWVHGPVNREIWDRFKSTKSMYSVLTVEDIRPVFNLSSLADNVQTHIREVIEAYGKLTDDQLENLTHAEEPWQVARDNCKAYQRCETVIPEDTMKRYYRLRNEQSTVSC
jgi:uncharacterized phage-associated protein